MVDNQRRSQAHRNRLAAEEAVPDPPSDGMTLWLSADAVEGLSDGESINGATIPDLSGNGLDMTGSVGTYEENELNGYPVLQNLTSNTIMQRSGVVMRDVFGTNACTIYTVYQVPTSTSVRIFYECTGKCNINWNWSGRIYFTHQDALGAGLSMNETRPATWVGAYHLLECWRDGADGAITYDNGTLIIAETDTDEAIADVTDTLQMVPVSYGQFAEFIAYDRALNAAERQQVRDYLADKYALW